MKKPYEDLVYYKAFKAQIQRFIPVPQLAAPPIPSVSSSTVVCMKQLPCEYRTLTVDCLHRSIQLPDAIMKKVSCLSLGISEMRVKNQNLSENDKKPFYLSR